MRGGRGEGGRWKGIAQLRSGRRIESPPPVLWRMLGETRKRRWDICKLEFIIRHPAVPRVCQSGGYWPAFFAAAEAAACNSDLTLFWQSVYALRAASQCASTNPLPCKHFYK